MSQDPSDETEPPSQVTELLNAWQAGRQGAVDELIPFVYQELRKLARSYLRNERPDHTLQATALVNEAYLRLMGQKNVQWENRKHFFGIASQLMRRILVDHARKRAAGKRGGAEPLVLFDEDKVVPSEQPDLVELDAALDAFAKIDPDQAKLVELRYFTGLTIDETAKVLELSPATVKREWIVAKAWLRRELMRKNG